MKRKHDNGFPGRDAIVAFIRANPGKIGTREIAREFGLKNADRVELKRILRELADEGTVTRHTDYGKAGWYATYSLQVASCTKAHHFEHTFD